MAKTDLCPCGNSKPVHLTVCPACFRSAPSDLRIQVSATSRRAGFKARPVHAIHELIEHARKRGQQNAVNPSARARS